MIRLNRELVLFSIALFVMGMAYSIYDTTFNNFLNERFLLSGFQRSLLEFPRELPGVLVAFVSAMLWYLCSRRLGVVSMVLGLVGTLLIGFFSSTYASMIVCLFIYSLGQHLFIPISSGIGMELAEESKIGQRLGQLNALRNLAIITGSFFVFLGFRYLRFNFHHTFTLTAIGFGISAVLLYAMRPQTQQHPNLFLKLHREYRLFYLLNILAGSRKQIFLTFAPWVIVTIFHKPTETIAILMTIGGFIGILFQPFLGWAIDRFGERLILTLEPVLLIIVCLGYGFSKFVMPENIAFIAICLFYLIDQMLFSVGMARSMYIKKIALKTEDIQPTLTVGVTIDHVFSISIALIGGAIWNSVGFQYVFLLGVLIAILNFFTARKITFPTNT